VLEVRLCSSARRELEDLRSRGYGNLYLLELATVRGIIP